MLNTLLRGQFLVVFQRAFFLFRRFILARVIQQLLIVLRLHGCLHVCGCTPGVIDRVLNYFGSFLRRPNDAVYHLFVLGEYLHDTVVVIRACSRVQVSA